jgi:hypothetical protein
VKVITLATLLLLLFFSNGYTSEHEEYSKIYPEHFEYCTGTQLKYVANYNDGVVGGPGGHGFMYVHGLCKDYRFHYPQVKICDGSEDHQGVGISLDGDFKNVQWIAVPGREFFLNGNLSRNQEVNHESLNRYLDQVIEKRIVEGVEFNPETSFEGVQAQSIAPKTKKYERFVAEYLIGTDLAINWGRDLKCARIPVQKEKLAGAAELLNNLNKEYYLNPDKDYSWSMIYNNCAHLSLNVGAQLGLNKAMKTDQNLFRQLSHIAVPANVFMLYADIALLNDISLYSIERDDLLRKNLVSDSFVPTAAGGLVAEYPTYQNNKLFIASDLRGVSIVRKKTLRSLIQNTATGFLGIGSLLFSGVSMDFNNDGKDDLAINGDYQNLFSNPIATDLKTNLEWWLKRYNHLLSNVDSTNNSVENTAYIRYLNTQKFKTRNKLRLLNR